MPNLFPLPVSPFEYYYLCDDRANYPTTFFIELTFSGQLERGPLEGALALVLSRHPLLTARIDMNNGGRPNWLPGTAPQIDWAQDGQPLLAPGNLRIDLQTSPGLRVWVRVGEPNTRLVVQFHHACCDGLAGARFAEELLLAYHALFDANGPALPPLDPLRLLRRDDLGDAAPKVTWSDRWNTVAFWTRALLRSPAVIAAPSPPAIAAASTHLDFPYVAGMRSAVFTAEEMRSLRRAATQQQATLNDLLLRDLFLVLGQWNADHGGTSRRLRINIPTTLQEKFDKEMPAANALGFAFLTRNIRPRTDAQALLGSIQREMERIRRDRAGRFFLGGLAFACGFPGLVPWALRRPRCFATAVLSNLGRLGARSLLPRQGRKAIVGNAILERITGVPPIRPHTRAALAVIQYGGETTLGLACDPRFIDSRSADELLARYVSQLRSSMGEVLRETESATTVPQAGVLTGASAEEA